jgi:hypothetical protein
VVVLLAAACLTAEAAVVVWQDAHAAAACLSWSGKRVFD